MDEHNIGQLAPDAAQDLLKRDILDPGWSERILARDRARHEVRKRTRRAPGPLYTFVSATSGAPPAPLSAQEQREQRTNILTAAGQLSARTGISFKGAAGIVRSMMAAQGPQLPAQNEPPGTPQRKPKPMETHGGFGNVKGSGPPGASTVEPSDTVELFTKFFNLATSIQKQHPDWPWQDCKIAAREQIAAEAAS